MDAAPVVVVGADDEVPVAVTFVEVNVATEVLVVVIAAIVVLRVSECASGYARRRAAIEEGGDRRGVRD